MPPEYEELDTVQVANAEIVISAVTRTGKKRSLGLAPRKSFFDHNTNSDRLYIPQFSSMELTTISQVEDLIAALIEACQNIFHSEPRRLVLDNEEKLDGEMAPDAEIPPILDGPTIPEPDSPMPTDTGRDHEWFRKYLSKQLYDALHLIYGLFTEEDFCRLDIHEVARLRGVFHKQIEEFRVVQRGLRRERLSSSQRSTS